MPARSTTEGLAIIANDHEREGGQDSMMGTVEGEMLTVTRASGGRGGDKRRGWRGSTAERQGARSNGCDCLGWPRCRPPGWVGAVELWGGGYGEFDFFFFFSWLIGVYIFS